MCEQVIYQNLFFAVVEVELVPSIDEARLNRDEAYRLSVSNKRIKIGVVKSRSSVLNQTSSKISLFICSVIRMWD